LVISKKFILQMLDAESQELIANEEGTKT